MEQLQTTKATEAAARILAESVSQNAQLKTTLRTNALQREVSRDTLKNGGMDEWKKL